MRTCSIYDKKVISLKDVKPSKLSLLLAETACKIISYSKKVRIVFTVENETVTLKSVQRKPALKTNQCFIQWSGTDYPTCTEWIYIALKIIYLSKQNKNI